MDEIEKIKARLANTEKALFALTTILVDYQAPQLQNDINLIMCDYFDANTSLGFEPCTDFISDNSQQ